MGLRRSRPRIFVLTAGLVGGVAIGLLVVATLTGSRQPAAYRPFFAGMKDSRVENIQEGGPVLIPDPKGGERAFYLDLDGDQIVALHVVPPGGSARCPVQFDRRQRRYEDCDGLPVDPATLGRFRVIIRVNDEEEEEEEEEAAEAVFVDLRELVPPVTPRS